MVPKFQSLLLFSILTTSCFYHIALSAAAIKIVYSEEPDQSYFYKKQVLSETIDPENDGIQPFTNARQMASPDVENLEPSASIDVDDLMSLNLDASDDADIPLSSFEMVSDSNAIAEASQTPDMTSDSESASTTTSSDTITGDTGPANVVHLAVVSLTVIGMFACIVAIVFYSRTASTYRPFITGASLSEESLDFSGAQLPENSHDRIPVANGSSRPRRYDALSLERDVGTAQHYEAATYLEDIPDRHVQQTLT